MKRTFTFLDLRAIHLRYVFIGFVFFLLVSMDVSVLRAGTNFEASMEREGFTLTVMGDIADPTVDAGENQTITLPTSTASFTATANDTDGTIASYAWTTVSSPAGSVVTLTGATTSQLDVDVDLAGTYTFEVTVTDNQGATATDQVNLIVNEALGTPIEIEPGSTCGPGPVTLLAEPGSGGDAVRWYDASVDGTLLATTILGESYTTSTISTTTSYWVSTYNSSTGAESGRVEVVATVKDVPSAPTVTVVDNCDGTSTLTASNYIGSLLWSTGETTASITVTTAGEYTVTQTVNGCTSAAAAGTAAPKSSPAEPSITNIQSSYYTSDPSVTFTGDPAGGTFTLNGTAFDGAFDPCAVGAGTHKIRYTVTNTDGCSNYKEYEVTVVQATYTVIITADPFPICKGQNTKYTAHVYKNAEIIYPYLEDPALITKANPVTTYNPAYDTYLPAETDPIHKLYPARFFQPVVLSGELMPSSDFSYQWTKNEEQNIGPGNEIFKQSGLSSTDYYKVYVTEKSNDGCVTTITNQLSNPMYISEPDGYTIKVSAEPTAICKGESVMFTATLGSGFDWDLANLQMSWYLDRSGSKYLVKGVSGTGDLQLSSSEINTALTNSGVSPAELIDGDKVYVEFETDLESILSGDSKCKSRQTSLAVTMIVNDLSAEAFSSQTICQYESATFTTTVTTTGTAQVSYQWYHDGLVISGATESSLTIESAQPADAGAYSVVVTNGCPGTESPIEAGTLTIQETQVFTAELEYTWLDYGKWEIKAVEKDPIPAGSFGTDPIYVFYRKDNSVPTAWYEVQRSSSNTYIEENASADIEIRAEVFNTVDCILSHLIGPANNPLPVEMIYFTAEQKGEDVLLQWATATESFNTGFEVQMSDDPRHYRVLSFVESLKGDSKSVQKYEYVDDESGKSGRRYYRLKQVDTDGAVSFYGPVVTEIRGKAEVAFYPNPFKDKLEIEIYADDKGEVVVTLSNAIGSTVLQRTLKIAKGKNEKQLLFGSFLPAGVYFLTIRMEGSLNKYKLLKQ